MSERDDDVLRRYRALDRASPPAHLDAAILAASRDAATPRRTTRWAIPASIAAVMVLALGLVLKVQREAPGEMTAPAARSEEKAMVAPAARSDEKEMVAPAAKPAQEAKQEPVAHPGATANALRDAPVAQSAPPVQTMPAPPPAPARAEFQERRRAQSKLQGAAPETSAPSAKLAKDANAETPEQALERIARLREEGKDDEADKALETFRREHPGFRIAPAMWERVRRR